jgi:hypothetical protein
MEATMPKIFPTSGIFGHLRPNRSALFCLLSLAGMLALTGQTQAQTVSARGGHGTAAVAAVVNLGALPQMTAAEIAATPHVSKPFHTGVDPTTFAAQKARAAALRFAAPAGAITAPPASAQKSGQMTPGASGGWFSTSEVACGNVTPADQAIAVGDGGGSTPAVIQAINTCVDVYTKGGGLLSGYPKSFTSFFAVASGTPTSDPRAIYDWIAHRYILVMIDFDPNYSKAMHYNIAVSTGDNPNGTYCIYHLGVLSVAPAGGVFPLPDFPRIGQDRQAIYLASNIFNPSYKWEEIMALPKAQMYACQNIGFNYYYGLNIGGTYTDTTQPANIYSSGDQPRSEYMVTSRNIFFGGGGCSSGCNGLVVWSWYQPLSGGADHLAGVTVATTNNYSLPPAAVQKGTSTTIDSGDTRLSGIVVYAAGKLYASLNSNGGASQPDCILYEIKPYVTYSTGNIASATIENEIVLGGGANSWYYCTQQPDPEGNVTTVFSFSGSSVYASLAYISRRSAQPKGGFGDSGLYLANGAASYFQGRWGDYTATSIAGLVSGGGTGGFPTMWFAGMLANSDGTWGTAIGYNGYTDVTQP